MTTFVRYSVAVYLGLLLAGAVVVPEPLAAAGGWLRLMDPDQQVDDSPLLPPGVQCQPVPTPVLELMPLHRPPHPAIAAQRNEAR